MRPDYAVAKPLRLRRGESMVEGAANVAIFTFPSTAFGGPPPPLRG
jgi:hypothetical protein